MSCCIEIKVHYHFHNSLPVELTLSQCNQSVSWHPISSWTILTVSFHICLCLIHEYSLSYFLNKILCKFLICHIFYTGCPGGNVPDFGRMFLKLQYTDITKNTYIRSWTVTEIKVRDKCGLLAVPRTVPGSGDILPVHCACPSLSTAGSSAFKLRLHM